MCGIFGIINQRPKAFDYSTFCTLGVANDARGGDSCGIFIDGQVEYGVGANKYFECFMDPAENGSTILPVIEKSQIALGHCRKASVGTISEKTAQPVVIYNEEDPTKPDFVVIHNGTIYDYKELAAKYIPNIDITGMTDSQVMTRIFYYKGYDVLDEYHGGATFVIVDYREDEPRIFFWRAESKNSAYSQVISEERPLYMCVGKHDLVFSSIGKFLPALRRKSYYCVPLANWLIEYKGKELIKVKEYPRLNTHQGDISRYANNYSATKPATTTTTTTTTSTTRQNTLLLEGNPVGKFGASAWVQTNRNTGQCSVNNVILHGKHMITSYGHICDEPTNNYAANYKPMYFWNGILLKNEECFTFLNDLAEEIDATPKDIYECFLDVVLYLSPCPFVKDDGFTLWRITSTLTKEPFTGQMMWPFDSSQYIYENGRFKRTNQATCSESLRNWENNKNVKINFNDLLDIL